MTMKSPEQFLNRSSVLHNTSDNSYFRLQHEDLDLVPDELMGDEDDVQYNGEGCEGLFGAVMECNEAKVVQLLTDQGVVENIDCVYISQKSRSALHAALIQRQERLVKMLVDAGASVGDVEDADGETPLLYAVMYMPRILPYLIENGKHRNLRRVDHLSQNILHRIVSREGGGPFASTATRSAAVKTVPKVSNWERLPVLKILVENHGVSTTQRDNNGFLPHEWARENYLYLGAEADSIIELLQKPPSTLTIGGGSTTASGIFFSLISRLFLYPITRFIVIILLLIGHIIQYLTETIDRSYAFSRIDSMNYSLQFESAVVEGVSILYNRSVSYESIAATQHFLRSDDLFDFMGQLQVGTPYNTIRLENGEVGSILKSWLSMTRFCSSGLSNDSPGTIRELSMFQVIFFCCGSYYFWFGEHIAKQ